MSTGALMESLAPHLKGFSAMLSIRHKFKIAAEFNLRYPDDNTLTELLAWVETEIELDF